MGRQSLDKRWEDSDQRGPLDAPPTWPVYWINKKDDTLADRMRKPIWAITCAVALGVAASTYNLRRATMPEIKFDVGENIYETANRSGAPKYSTGNVAGLVSYEIDSLPPDIPARYQRHGYEITALPLFAFTMYADEESNDGLAVQTATLQFSKNAATTHLSAQKFVSDLISQFQKGKWVRHIRELCPSVSGRSAFLNERGACSNRYLPTRSSISVVK